MSLGSHTNVYNTCLRILRQRGFSLRLHYRAEEDDPPFWIAEKDGFRFTGDNPIELLGLTAIFDFVKPTKDEPYWWTVPGEDIRSELEDPSHPGKTGTR